VGNPAEETYRHPNQITAGTYGSLIVLSTGYARPKSSPIQAGHGSGRGELAARMGASCEYSLPRILASTGASPFKLFRQRHLLRSPSSCDLTETGELFFADRRRATG
jgi:hypothetical protein